MTALLGAASLAVLLAPVGRPALRLRDIAGRHGSVDRELPWGSVIGATVCVTAVLLWGLSAGVTAVMVAAAVRWQVTRRRRQTRALRAIDGLLTALSAMIAELSVGAPPAHACRQAAVEMPATAADSPETAIGEMLRHMAGRAELGGDVAEGIATGHGGADQAVSRVAAAWRTSERHGLPMVDLLGAVRDDLLARRRAADRTRAALAGARATAMVLSALPLLGIGLGQAIGADPVAVLLGGGIGGILLVVGTGLVIGGQVWSEHIIGKVAAP
ncbi:type II secretion system F family protein [Williamsia sterculiae]|uniref:Type II secretion system protein F (GspF) n=1 Tax=Williamsia sterculiae TaxID=1344003 RepID=A0A1N7F3K3_9NOCA|nr:type II secretion system F family protein [Williamsia sterculiae]SIR94891.1 type II secretion system protein F (GspF) [Williamsia sterculiae]